MTLETVLMTTGMASATAPATVSVLVLVSLPVVISLPVVTSLPVVVSLPIVIASYCHIANIKNPMLRTLLPRTVVGDECPCPHQPPLVFGSRTRRTNPSRMLRLSSVQTMSGFFLSESDNKYLRRLAYG